MASIAPKGQVRGAKLGMPVGQPTPKEMTPGELVEERRQWADYYEAAARVVEIMRSEGTTAAVLPRIVREASKAAAALKRLREIHGMNE